MNTRRLAEIIGFFLGTVGGFLLITGTYFGATTEAACPGLLGVQGWPSYTVQNYVAVTFTQQESNNIDEAMGTWTAHNVPFVNCSNVSFFPSAFGSYVITSTTGTNPAHADWGADTSVTSVSGGHITTR